MSSVLVAEDQPVLATNDLKMSFGKHEVLKGIDLRAERGEVLGVLGPNGAGKTTLIDLLCGFAKPTFGEIEVLGDRPWGASRLWQSRVGIVPQGTGTFDDLTVREVISSFAACYPAPLSVESVLELTELSSEADRLCRVLSGGQRRRVDLGLSIVGNPELIFLDEPTTGLDPDVRRRTWQMIEDLASSGKTIVLTTHYLEEVERLATSVAILLDGIVAKRGTVAQLTSSREATISLAFEAGVAVEPPALLDGTAFRFVDERWVATSSDPLQDAGHLNSWVASVGLQSQVAYFEVRHASLEDIYLRLVQHSIEGKTSG